MEKILNVLCENGYQGPIGISSGLYFYLATTADGERVIRIFELGNRKSYLQMSIKEAIDEYGEVMKEAFLKSKGKFYGVKEKDLKKLDIEELHAYSSYGCAGNREKYSSKIY